MVSNSCESDIFQAIVAFYLHQDDGDKYHVNICMNKGVNKYGSDR